MKPMNESVVIHPDHQQYLEALSSPYATVSREEAVHGLALLQSTVSACRACDELSRCRNNTVFGTGNVSPRICFIGEAPGAEEDARGEPFVGAAGRLLDRIIEACGLRRKDVYICNILKCRPPQNRRPLPGEVKNCLPFLSTQLAVIKPQVICCLGATAATTLLGIESSMGRLRGRFYEYEGIPVLCTYHPAYLLRTPQCKRDVWADMKLLLSHLGLEVPT